MKSNFMAAIGWALLPPFSKLAQNLFLYEMKRTSLLTAEAVVAIFDESKVILALLAKVEAQYG